MELPGKYSLTSLLMYCKILFPAEIISELDAPVNARDIKKICIIGGGGSAGLASLKTILDTPQFKRGIWQTTAYEAREGLGGVW